MKTPLCKFFEEKYLELLQEINISLLNVAKQELR